MKESFTGAETRNRNTVDGGRCDDLSPTELTFVDRVGEEIVQQKIFQRRIFLERRFDVAQENAEKGSFVAIVQQRNACTFE